jgi:hypothetical protein
MRHESHIDCMLPPFHSHSLIKIGGIKNYGLIFIHYIYNVCKTAYRQWIDFRKQDFYM